MVNSRSDEAMKEIDNLREHVGSVERKLDTLAVSVDAAFVEQRGYTEFAFDRLRTEMRAGFGRLERKLDQLSTRSRARQTRPTSPYTSRVQVASRHHRCYHRDPVDQPCPSFVVE